MRVMQQDAARKSARAREQMFDSGMAAAAGAAALAYPLKMAANYERLRVSMIALTGSNEEGMRVYNEVIKLAAETPLELAQVAKATNMMMGYGASAEQSTRSVKMLGDITALTNGQLDNAIVAYGQARQEGKMLTRDLRQFINAGVPIVNILQDIVGEQKNVFDMAEQGQISFALLEEALTKATSAGGRFENGLGKLSGTAEGLFTRLIDKLGFVASAFGDSLLPEIKQVGEAMIPVLDSFTEWVKESPRFSKAIMGTIMLYTGLALAAMTYAGYQFIANTMAGAMTIALFRIPFIPIIKLFGLLSSAVTYFRLAMMYANGSMLGAVKIIWASLLPALQGAWAGLMSINAVLWANPITWVVGAVIALSAAITVGIIKWKEWGAAMLMFINPLFNVLMSIREHWNSITKAFSEDGFLSGILAIGKAIMDGVLYPLQQLMSVIHSITGFDWAKNAESAILGVRARVGIDTDTLTTASAVAPNQTAQAQTSTINQISPTATAQGRTELNYSPTITIGSGATEAERESFMRILEQHKEEMFRMFKEEQRLQARRSFA